MRKFDVKKNSFLRKDLLGPYSIPSPLPAGGALFDIKFNIRLQKQFIIL
jgi:hypothetical protein